MLELIIKTAIVLNKNHPNGFNTTEESDLAEGYGNIPETMEAIQLKRDIDQHLIDLYDHGLQMLISKFNSQEIKIAGLIQTNTDNKLGRTEEAVQQLAHKKGIKLKSHNL